MLSSFDFDIRVCSCPFHSSSTKDVKKHFIDNSSNFVRTGDDFRIVPEFAETIGQTLG